MDEGSKLINEKEILQQIANGDEQAFRILFTQYHERLAQYIYRMTDSIQLAEEIVQDTFLKVWTTREALTQIDNFASWLFVLSRHKALNALRTIARERRRQTIYSEGSPTVELPPEENQSHYFNLIDQAVRSLSPQQQKVYILSRQKRLTYKEIAKEMNLSPETVKTYLQLAISAISTHIKKNIDIVLFLATLSTFSKK